ncbi:hypothetical protein [Flavobacterium gilvum]|uniref:Uncharacterized protein n=2 Tax=Flavobacterium gilvum TaxID=1492737 RepID=A0AAC9I3Q3_9FLAO|nr:hypothetical protein [Flavobacterium gilvum]AOW08123.1 hypothetical protein EM308_00600 [Flavobacterium gilvum]
MRKFIFYISEIILIVLAVAFLIQCLADRGLQNWQNNVYNDWQNTLEGKINSDVIIMGSSRGFVGYNSKIIEDKLRLKTYNISYNAGGNNLQLSKLNIYLKNNKKPKILIQNIDLAHFDENDILPEEFQFIPFLNNPDIDDLLVSFDSKYTDTKYLPLLKYNQNLKLLKNGIYANFKFFNIENATTYQGYCPQNRTFKIEYHNLKKIKGKSKEGVDSNRYKKILKKMTDFYKLNLDSSTKIIFVWAPENKLRLNKEYDSLKSPLIEEINLIQKKNKNIYFIDLSHHLISKNDYYFYDTFHLNKKGSEVFSEILSIKLSQLLN